MSTTSIHQGSGKCTVGRVLISGEVSTPTEVTLGYVEQHPSTGNAKGTVLLIHGFPETSHQWRDVVPLLSQAGYRVLAPDYRGAGSSSKPRGMEGYRKAQMADDLVKLLDALGVKDKVHVIGHDIGGMVAHSFAARFGSSTRSVMWGECPLPGTKVYEELKNTAPMFHFTFHQQQDLPETLEGQGQRKDVALERYLTHFYSRHSFNHGVWRPSVVEHYVQAFSEAGAFRCGMDTYRCFPLDARDNQEWLQKEGKCKVPACAECAKDIKRQFEEFYEGFETLEVDESGHWVAEENPEDCAEKILSFVSKH